MAEMIQERVTERSDYGPGSGFDAMGRPVPDHRKQAGYNLCRELGCDTEAAWSATNGCALAIASDEPYVAMRAASRYLDLTGVYRLIAVLCTAEEE